MSTLKIQSDEIKMKVNSKVADVLKQITTPVKWDEAQHIRKQCDSYLDILKKVKDTICE